MRGYQLMFNQIFSSNEENLFSFEELSRIDDHRRAISRDSQNRDIENMIKIIMYGVNDVMKIINSKNLL